MELVWASDSIGTDYDEIIFLVWYELNFPNTELITDLFYIIWAC